MSVWVFNYWTDLIIDFETREILTSGSTKVPSYLVYLLSLTAILAGFIIVLEPFQRFLLKVLRQAKKNSFLLANDIYVLLFIRLIIYIIVFLLFGWIVSLNLDIAWIEFIKTN